MGKVVKLLYCVFGRGSSRCHEAVYHQLACHFDSKACHVRIRVIEGMKADIPYLVWSMHLNLTIVKILGHS